jgi:hypothetical protein
VSVSAERSEKLSGSVQEKLKSVLILSEKDYILDKHSVNSYTDFQKKSNFAVLPVGDILPAALRNSISGNL